MVSGQPITRNYRCTDVMSWVQYCYGFVNTVVIIFHKFMNTFTRTTIFSSSINSTIKRRHQQAVLPYNSLKTGEQLKLIIIIIFCMFAYNFHYNRFIIDWIIKLKAWWLQQNCRLKKTIKMLRGEKEEKKMKRKKDEKTHNVRRREKKMFTISCDLSNLVWIGLGFSWIVCMETETCTYCSIAYCIQ